MLRCLFVTGCIGTLLLEYRTVQQKEKPEPLAFIKASPAVVGGKNGGSVGRLIRAVSGVVTDAAENKILARVA